MLLRFQYTLVFGIFLEVKLQDFSTLAPLILWGWMRLTVEPTALSEDRQHTLSPPTRFQQRFSLQVGQPEFFPEITERSLMGSCSQLRNIESLDCRMCMSLDGVASVQSFFKVIVPIPNLLRAYECSICSKILPNPVLSFLCNFSCTSGYVWYINLGSICIFG